MNECKKCRENEHLRLSTLMEAADEKFHKNLEKIEDEEEEKEKEDVSGFIIVFLFLDYF